MLCDMLKTFLLIFLGKAFARNLGDKLKTSKSLLNNTFQPPCPPFEVYKKCGPVCQETCESALEPVNCTASHCASGCFCQPGYIRSLRHGACIPLPQCELCYMKPEAGPCEESILRFYYNKDAHTCLPLMYGGCQGNENNFQYFDDCMNTCERPITCADGTPPVNCIDQQCRTTRCHIIPQATCVEDHCKGCAPRFLLSNGEDVTKLCYSFDVKR